jgi:hypothetical protein
MFNFLPKLAGGQNLATAGEVVLSREKFVCDIEFADFNHPL